MIIGSDEYFDKIAELRESGVMRELKPARGTRTLHVRELLEWLEPLRELNPRVIIDTGVHDGEWELAKGAHCDGLDDDCADVVIMRGRELKVNDPGDW